MPYDNLDELQLFLKGKTKDIELVVMPDFFLDRLMNVESDVNTLSQKLHEVVSRKGGCIDNVNQVDQRGGNAINTASALTALGAKVTPIVCTSQLGLEQMRFHIKSQNIDLTHVKIFDNASITTAIEFTTESGKANVMIRDVGALTEFGPQHLTERDWEKIRKSDYVCVFNWAGTKEHGTELAETVFQQAKTGDKSKTYYDTADPTPNKEEIPMLMEKVLHTSLLNILSVNENEAVYYASYFDERITELTGRARLDDLAKEAAKTLASNISARVDLHATSFSATFSRNNETFVPAFSVPTLRATGAGDAWNAGNIIGDACNLPDEQRLTLANAVAAHYISSTHGVHPTRQQLRNFIQKRTHN